MKAHGVGVGGFSDLESRYIVVVLLGGLFDEMRGACGNIAVRLR